MGDYEFKGGYPTAKTIQKAYDDAALRGEKDASEGGSQVTGSA